MAIKDRLVIDIGGQDGKRAIGEAEDSPRTDYFIYDPNARRPDNCPTNVTFFRQTVSPDDPIPLKNSSADEVRLEFLMGEVITGERSTDMPDGIAKEKKLYGGLVSEAKRLVRQRGLVSVTDVKANIGLARQVFVDQGFETTQPGVVGDKHLSSEAEGAFKHVKLSKNGDDSRLLPMRFVARKK